MSVINFYIHGTSLMMHEVMQTFAVTKNKCFFRFVQSFTVQLLVSGGLHQFANFIVAVCTHLHQADFVENP